MSNSLLLATTRLLSEQKAHMVCRMLCVMETSTGLRASNMQTPPGLSEGWRGCGQEALTPVGTGKGIKSSLTSGN